MSLQKNIWDICVIQERQTSYAWEQWRVRRLGEILVSDFTQEPWIRNTQLFMNCVAVRALVESPARCLEKTKTDRRPPSTSCRRFRRLWRPYVDHVTRVVQKRPFCCSFGTWKSSRYPRAKTFDWKTCFKKIDVFPLGNFFFSEFRLRSNLS